MNKYALFCKKNYILLTIMSKNRCKSNKYKSLFKFWNFTIVTSNEFCLKVYNDDIFMSETIFNYLQYKL